MTNTTPSPNPDDVTTRLRRAITTASNDDYSEARSEKRERHVQRIIAMQDAVAEIDLLRRQLAERDAAAIEAAKKAIDDAVRCVPAGPFMDERLPSASVLKKAVAGAIRRLGEPQ